MESNSRTPALEMNKQEKEMVYQKKWAFSWFLTFCKVSDDWIIAGSLFHDARPATANARSPKLVFERGTWRSPCAAEWSRERTESSAFDRQSSMRYSGALPRTPLNDFTPISLVFSCKLRLLWGENTQNHDSERIRKEWHNFSNEV